MRGELKPRQAKFLKAYVETNSLSESAKRAGYKCTSLKSFSTVGRQVLNSLELSFPEVLNLCGVTDDLLGQKTYEGLHATRTMLASYEGKFRDSREIDDYPTRAKYIELAARMKGALIDRKELTGKDGGDIILQLSPRVSSNATKKTLEIDE